MLIGLLRQLAKLPLSWIHAAGGALGWVVYFLSPGYAARLRANLLQSGLWRDEKDYQRILRRSIAESGKAGTELIPVWFRPVAPRCPIGRPRRAHRAGRGRGKTRPRRHLPDPASGLLRCSRVVGCAAPSDHVLYRPPKMKALQTPDRGRPRTRQSATRAGQSRRRAAAAESAPARRSGRHPPGPGTRNR